MVAGLTGDLPAVAGNLDPVELVVLDQVPPPFETLDCTVLVGVEIVHSDDQRLNKVVQRVHQTVDTCTLNPVMLVFGNRVVDPRSPAVPSPGSRRPG